MLQATVMGLIQAKMQQLTTAAPSGSDFPPCCICPVPLFHVTACHHLFLSSIVAGRK
jgi:hypothetical protein